MPKLTPCLRTMSEAVASLAYKGSCDSELIPV